MVVAAPPTAKACQRCGVEKPLSEFNKNSTASDGHTHWCRECYSVYNRERYLASRDETIERVAVYRRKNPQAVLATRLRAVAKSPTSSRAHRAVGAALNAGVLVRPSVCSGCGDFPEITGPGGIQAHHHDYSKPLDVIWLCAKCHHAIHKSIRRRMKNDEEEAP